MKLCVVCAGMGRSCCTLRDIMVSGGDVERISSFTGKRPEQFLEFRAPALEAYLDQADDPNWLRYVTEPDGTRRLLRQHAGGNCVFLGEAGCVLPEGVRPLICRLHPLNYTEAGLAGVADDCPEECLDGEGILDNLEIDPMEAEGWRQQLYGELRQDREETGGTVIEGGVAGGGRTAMPAGCCRTPAAPVVQERGY